MPIVQMEGHGKLIDRDGEREQKVIQEIFSTGLPPLIFAPVQYTGSRFFVGLLMPHYQSTWPLTVPGAPFYYDHPTEDNIDLILQRVAEGSVLITTLRAEEDTARAWLKRGHMGLEYLAQMVIWEKFIKPNARFFLSVDGLDREAALLALATFIKRPLPTDWTPVG